MTPVNNEEQIIRHKLRELVGLVEQRDLIQAKIDKTEAAISAFIALLEDDLDQEVYRMQLKIAAKPLGLTESIKRIIREATRKRQGISPTDIKQRLEESGFPIGDYKNPNAVIHTTLLRLRDQSLIEESDKVNGIFTWIAKEPETPRSRELEAAEKVLQARTPKAGIGHKIIADLNREESLADRMLRLAKARKK